MYEMKLCNGIECFEWNVWPGIYGLQCMYGMNGLECMKRNTIIFE